MPDQGHGGAVQRTTDETLERISSADQDVSDEPNRESRDSSDPVWEAIEASFGLIDSDDYSGARAVIESVLSTHPGDSRLLLQLAWNDFHDPSRREAGLKVAEDLYRQEPANVEFITGYLSMLSFYPDYGAAIDVISGLDESVRREEAVSRVVQNIYGSLGWRHSQRMEKSGSGNGRPLLSRLRSVFTTLYWQTGGPLKPYLKWGHTLERDAKEIWRYWRRNLDSLNEIGAVDSVAVFRAKVEVDELLCRQALLNTRTSAVRKLLQRPFQLLLLLVVTAVSAVSQVVGGSDLLGAIVLAVSSVGLSVLLMASVNRLLRLSRTQLAEFVLGTAAWLAMLSAFVILSQDVRSVGAWQSFVEAALIVTLTVAPVVYLLAKAPDFIGNSKMRRVRREFVRASILDALLDVLYWENRGSSSGVESRDRIYALRALEASARWIRDELPKSFQVEDRATAEWAADRARGASFAVTVMAREIIAPRSGSSERVVRRLSKAIEAIATGNLGEMPWLEPQGDVQAPSVKHRVLHYGRILLLMVMPGLFFFLLSPALELPDSIESWGRIASFVWFLLYAAIELDPQLRDKLELARSLSEMQGNSKPGRETE